MQLRRARWIACLAVLLPAALSAQAVETGIVRGRVTDATGGQPVNSVQIVVQGTTIGGLTGANGEYILPNVPAGAQTILARRIGYAAKTVGRCLESAGSTGCRGTS